MTNAYYYANAQILKQEQLTYGAAEVPGYYETVETCNESGLQECIADCLYYQYFGETTSYADCNEYCRQYYCSTQQQWIPPVPMEVFVKPYFYVHDRLGSVRLLVVILNYMIQVYAKAKNGVRQKVRQ